MNALTMNSTRPTTLGVWLDEDNRPHRLFVAMHNGKTIPLVCPVGESHPPCPAREGLTFHRNNGYAMEAVATGWRSIRVPYFVTEDRRRRCFMLHATCSECRHPAEFKMHAWMMTARFVYQCYACGKRGSTDPAKVKEAWQSVMNADGTPYRPL